ncbi:MAG: LysM peptidoglycan-binding domain-containing protein [Nitrospirota bacterium]
MATGLKTFIQVAGIFIVMLFPGNAYVQEQKEPIKSPDTVVTEPVAQPSAHVIPSQEKPSSETLNNVVIPETETENAATAPAEQESGIYIVRQGDTLWDISHSFLKDPFLWPFIWKANPFIENPDLIYPGNKLVIPNLAPVERALQSAEEVVPKKQMTETRIEPQPQAAPRRIERSPEAPILQSKPTSTVPATVEQGSRLILPEEQPVPIIDKYAMLSAGFVNFEEETVGKIVGSPEALKNSFGFGDLVYVSFPSSQSVSVGDKFLITSRSKTIPHPRMKKVSGSLVHGLGILQIIAIDERKPSTARITLSFDTIEKNNRLSPYQEPVLVYEPNVKKDKDISGKIIATTDQRTINAQLNFVYLNQGSVDGVEPGDRFIVYDSSQKGSFPRKAIGEVQVFIVKPESSTAVVRKSIISLEPGNFVEYKR